VRQRLDRSDRDWTAAIEAMFRRHSFAPDDALAQTRVLYMMPIGSYALDIGEPIEARFMLAPRSLETFAGVKPGEGELTAFRADALRRAEAPDFEDPS
jgi:hypothetical protein